MRTLDGSMAAELAGIAPDLLDGYRDALPRARSAVATRLAEALWREDIGDARLRFRGPVHGFDRVVLGPVADDPLSLVDHAGLRAELDSAVHGLALAYARRALQDPGHRAAAAALGLPDLPALLADLDPDERVARLERLATEGHNLHPCGRTRLGWGAADMIAHDLETESTAVGFVAAPPELVLGDDLDERLGVAAPPGRRVLPVHIWQLRHLRGRSPELFTDGTLRVLDPVLPALPTAALRTVLLTNRPGPAAYLKLSLDIQVTSTRRTISVASTRNGPALSTVLSGLLDGDPDGERLLLMTEPAGTAGLVGDSRQLSTIVRDGLGDLLEPGDEPVPGSALAALDPVSGATVLSGLVDRYARTRGSTAPRTAALGFLTEYAELLLPPVLRLAARHGIGLEAHLQNCVPVFRDGVPHRMGIRDLAGMRVHLGRLTASGVGLQLWPGSVIGTADEAVLLAKVGYTAFQAHLGEVVLRLGQSHGLAEDDAWAVVRRIVDDALAGHPDRAFYTASTVPHKALTRMRLAGSGDVHVPVQNPLHAR
ncbi:IucA/IucC family protein [Catellatospora tritici]|uniref:IucA/IucC family protein n=1 Tax=Catellatospora tritici TaxID=2851566 RepID=UPI001C2DC728|nr:IucA/IucC family protein [Catellatospora tritici]MBV1853053.1 RhbF-like rhizobactin siderophore biosynthesis protein [Catellatospora tritici]